MATVSYPDGSTETVEELLAKLRVETLPDSFSIALGGKKEKFVKIKEPSTKGGFTEVYEITPVLARGGSAMQTYKKSAALFRKRNGTVQDSDVIKYIEREFVPSNNNNNNMNIMGGGKRKRSRSKSRKVRKTRKTRKSKSATRRR